MSKIQKGVQYRTGKVVCHRGENLRSTHRRGSSSLWAATQAILLCRED